MFSGYVKRAPSNPLAHTYPPPPHTHAHARQAEHEEKRRQKESVELERQRQKNEIAKIKAQQDETTARGTLERVPEAGLQVCQKSPLFTVKEPGSKNKRALCQPTMLRCMCRARAVPIAKWRCHRVLLKEKSPGN